MQLGRNGPHLSTPTTTDQDAEAEPSSKDHMIRGHCQEEQWLRRLEGPGDGYKVEASSCEGGGVNACKNSAVAQKPGLELNSPEQNGEKRRHHSHNKRSEKTLSFWPDPSQINSE